MLLQYKCFKRKRLKLAFILVFWLTLAGFGYSADKNTGSKSKTYIFYTAVHSPTFEILEGRLKEAFRRIGLNAQVVKAVSAQRALILANEQGDGDANRVVNVKQFAPKNTSNLIRIPESIRTEGIYVYSKNINFKVNGWKSLEGYRNGARFGAKIFENNLPEKRTFAATNLQLLNMLETDRLDFIVDWEHLTRKAIKDHKFSTIKQLEPAINMVTSFPYIQKKHKAIVPKIARALSEMKKEGTFQRIEDDVLNGKVKTGHY
ncbi:MAG: transporter substrate-binding domain-containing protein [SAR324 cluster bacterium]|nr:transporter substrate-binding domain-containing protein [SAR324 cluster bacterium]